MWGKNLFDDFYFFSSATWKHMLMIQYIIEEKDETTEDMS